MPQSLNRLLCTALISLLFCNALPSLAKAAPASIASAAGISPSADSKHNLSQRLQFIRAQKLLMSGEIRAFRKAREKLDGYVIAPHLDYLYLRQAVAGRFGLRANDEEVRAFIAKHPTLASNFNLERALLHRYIANGEWDALLENWKPTSNVALRCNWLNARIRKQPKDVTISRDALALWMVPTDQVSDCDPVFAWLEKNNQLTSKRRWQRIHLLLENRKLNLARYIAKELPKADQVEFAAWAKMYEAPEKNLRSALLQQEQWNAEQIAFGLRRQARIDSEVAAELWPEVRRYFALDDATQAELAKAIALRKAWRRQTDALAALESLPAEAQDIKVREWTLRTAIYQANWPAVLRTYALLPPAEQQQEDWRYWNAKALIAVGKAPAARSALISLANSRDYYGYLAADLLDATYSLRHKPVKADPVMQTAILKNLNLLRARELYAVDQQILAHREWEQAFKTFNPKEQVQAALLADSWGWYFQSLRGLAKAGEFDDLGLRYPTPWLPIINQNSSKQTLDESWIFGLMRSESLFRDSARSPVGALGLMQVMPATGRGLAKRHKVRLDNNQELLNPDTNILLGTAYMREMLDRFDQNMVLATAAYNAGPSRVKRYLPEQTPVAADIWIETLPVNETRTYVKRVLEHTTVYDWRLAGKMVRLNTRMPIIPASNPSAEPTANSKQQAGNL